LQVIANQGSFFISRSCDYIDKEAEHVRTRAFSAPLPGFPALPRELGKGNGDFGAGRNAAGLWLAVAWRSKSDLAGGGAPPTVFCPTVQNEPVAGRPKPAWKRAPGLFEKQSKTPVENAGNSLNYPE
jgi:hypothetical protein